MYFFLLYLIFRFPAIPCHPLVLSNTNLAGKYAFGRYGANIVICKGMAAQFRMRCRFRRLRTAKSAAGKNKESSNELMNALVWGQPAVSGLFGNTSKKFQISLSSIRRRLHPKDIKLPSFLCILWVCRCGMTADVVQCSTTELHVEPPFSNSIRIYTDGSVGRDTRCTTAFCALYFEHKGNG